MKLILTQNEAIERLRHFLQIKEDCQVIISRPRVKTEPKTKGENEQKKYFAFLSHELRSIDHNVSYKIRAIKFLRVNSPGLGLADAKFLIENWGYKFVNGTIDTLIPHGIQLTIPAFLVPMENII